MDSLDVPLSDVTELVERALANDQAAWREIVDRYKGVAWKVLYGYNLSEDDRQDAFASTFFRLFERLGTVRDVEKLPGWIATTARNEANTLYRKRARLEPMAEMPVRAVDVAEHSEGLEDHELRSAMRRAFSRLPAEMQTLLRLLCADPPIAYAEISRVLNLPHGSIGPTRLRCLQRLRASPELAPYLNGGT